MTELEARRFDLVLSDVRMPVADGIELVERLSDGRLPDLRIFLMSGYLDFSAPEALDRGALGIFQKPLQLDVVEKALHRQLLPPAERWRDDGGGSGAVFQRSLPPWREALDEGLIELGRDGFFLNGVAFGLTPGTMTRFDFRFGDGASLVGTGKVVWNRDERRSVYAAGCGMLIDRLTPASIATFVKGLGSEFVKAVVPLGIPKKYR